MASAWFVDVPAQYRRGVKLFCWKKTLTEVAELWKGRLTKSTSKAQDFATRAACVDAYERRCDALVADGWHAQYREAYGANAPKRPPARSTEAELEAMSKELAAALKAADGDPKLERAAIARAVKRYRAAREAAGEPPDEFIVHFFAVDGVGLARKRKPALRRVRATAVVVARWTAMLERAAAPRRSR